MGEKKSFFFSSPSFLIDDVKNIFFSFFEKLESVHMGFLFRQLDDAELYFPGNVLLRSSQNRGLADVYPQLNIFF